MSKTILITGASSFLGAHTAQYLAKTFRVIGIWHQTPLKLPNVESLQWNLLSSSCPSNILAEVDVVLHLAGKIQNSPEYLAHQINRQMMQTVLAMQKPVIYGSSTAVHWPQQIPYVQSRQEDEAALMGSGLPYAILRPCAPYGPKLLTHQPKHQESFQTLINTIRRSPVVPIIGNGHYLRQPLHVQDFAAFCQYFLQNAFEKEVWDVAGGSVHSFNEIIAILQSSMGTEKRTIHVPKRAATFAARFVPNLEPSLISVIDNDESFNIANLQKRVRMRPFVEGVWDLL